MNLKNVYIVIFIILHFIKKITNDKNLLTFNIFYNF